MTRARLRQYLSRTIRPAVYLLQQYLPLASHRERPFDLRVPVQRDGTGAWSVPGMVAKVAMGHPFLTNLAQGGRAVPGDEAIEGSFGPAGAAMIRNRIQTLAIDVARAVARRYRHAADLGLDIALDREGKPWLLEINVRDQRITFFQAGMLEAFRTLYKNPLEYCAYAARTGRGRRPEGRDVRANAQQAPAT